MQGEKVTARELLPMFALKFAYSAFLVFLYAVTVLAVPLCLARYTQECV